MLADSFYPLKNRSSDSKRNREIWIYNLRSQNHIPLQPLGVCFKPYAPASSLYLGKSCLSINQAAGDGLCLPKQNLEREIKDSNSTLPLPTLRGLLRLSEGWYQLPRKAFRVQLRAMRCWNMLDKNQSPKPA